MAEKCAANGSAFSFRHLRAKVAWICGKDVYVKLHFWCLWQHSLGQPFIILEVGTLHVDHKLVTLTIEGA